MLSEDEWKMFFNLMERTLSLTEDEVRRQSEIYEAVEILDEFANMYEINSAGHRLDEEERADGIDPNDHSSDD